MKRCFIKSIGVPPSNTKSLRGHPYKWLGQVIPNYSHSEYVSSNVFMVLVNKVV